MIRLPFRLRHAAALGVLLVPLGACGADDGGITAVGAPTDDPADSGRSALPSETTAGRSTGEPSGAGDAPTATAPTTEAGPATPAEALLGAVAAYRAELAGSPIRALELTVWFPESGAPYAALQSQDPSAPANVDERSWRDGAVSSPEPVRLSGDGSLEENLFGIDELNWDALATALDGAPALVEQQLATTFENARGVTHVIITKDLPFSPDTVARVYVDGGDRTGGGYVQYRADGTLDKVQA